MVVEGNGKSTMMVKSDYTICQSVHGTKLLVM